MSGVEILYTYSCMIEDGRNNWLGFIVGISLAILILTILTYINKSSEGSFIFFSAILGLFSGILASYIGADNKKVYVNEHKVIVSDEVSMNEFLEKYEIIDQEGKIYTVREREIEE